MSGSGEFDFIETALKPMTLGHPAALGLLDDAALLTPRPGHEIVLASDMLVEGRHFPAGARVEVIAARALHSNLSDLAAMGAFPLAFMSSVAFPSRWTAAQREQLASAFSALSRPLELPLIGGDTTAGGEELVISLTMIGEVPSGKALVRSGARAGDDLWVSGMIGDAGLGLKMAQNKLDTQKDLLERYENPVARLELGLALRGIASACIDVSDGLIADAGHLAKASGVGFEIESAMIPLSDPVLLWLENEGQPGLVRLASAGDDYELLFTAPSSRSGNILALQEETGLPVNWIGRVIAGEGCQLLDDAGVAIDVPEGGFTHF